MRTSTREFSDACILRATVSTTGFCGGDGGHGGHTLIELEDLGSTDISCELSEAPSKGVYKKVAISLGGDAELRVIIKALRFAADSLEALSRE